jgi:hypothetical protein
VPVRGITRHRSGPSVRVIEPPGAERSLFGRPEEIILVLGDHGVVKQDPQPILGLSRRDEGVDVRRDTPKLELDQTLDILTPRAQAVITE